MKKNYILIITVGMVIISNTFFVPITIGKGGVFKSHTDPTNEYLEYYQNNYEISYHNNLLLNEVLGNSIRMTDEQIEQLHSMIESIKDKNVQNILYNIVSNSLNESNEIHLMEIRNISMIIYDYISNQPPQINVNNDDVGFNATIPSRDMLRSGTSTYFYPDFWDNFDYHDGWDAAMA
jgi:hypothetical protein